MHRRGTDRRPIVDPSLNVLHTQRYTHPPPAVHQSMPPSNDDRSIEITQALRNLDRLFSRLNIPANCPLPVPTCSVATSSPTSSLRPQNSQVQSTLTEETSNAVLPALPDSAIYVGMPVKADENRQAKELCFNFVKGSCKNTACSRLHPSPIVASKICANSLGKSRCQNKDCRLLHGVKNLDDLLLHALPLSVQNVPSNTGEGPTTSSLAPPSVPLKIECTSTSQIRRTPIRSLIPSYDDLCHAFVIERCNDSSCQRVHPAPETVKRICRNYLRGFCHDRSCPRLHPLHPHDRPWRPQINSINCVHEPGLAAHSNRGADNEHERPKSLGPVLLTAAVSPTVLHNNHLPVTGTAPSIHSVNPSCSLSHENITSPSIICKSHSAQTPILSGIQPINSTSAADKGSSRTANAQIRGPHPSLPASKGCTIENNQDSKDTGASYDDKPKEVCHRYLAGHCNWGSLCRRHHPPVSECRTKHPSVMAATLNMENFCILAVLGECSSPDLCGLPHVPTVWTAKICKDYLRRRCRVDKSCHQFHPPGKEISDVSPNEVESSQLKCQEEPTVKLVNSKSSQGQSTDNVLHESDGAQVTNSTTNERDSSRKASGKPEVRIGQPSLPVDQITTWAGPVDLSGWDCSSSSSDEGSDFTESSFVVRTASTPSTSVSNLSAVTVKSAAAGRSAQSDVCQKRGCQRKGKCFHGQVCNGSHIDSGAATPTIVAVDHLSNTDGRLEMSPSEIPTAPPGLGPPRKENVPGVSLSAKSSEKLENTPTSTSTSIVPRGSYLTLTLLDHVKVHYGPGFDVVDVATAFESRWVFLDDVPGLVKDTAIIEFLKPFGTAEEIQRPVYPPVDNNPITIKVRFAKPAQALKAAVLLTGLDFFGCTISARLAINNTGGGNGMLRDSTVKVVWNAPAQVGYAGYETLEKAQDVVRIVNGSEMNGYQVKASLWHGSPCVGRHNVIFENLPPQCTLEMLEQYAPRADLILQRPNYTSVDRATASIRRIMASRGEVIRFNNPAPPVRGRCVAWVEYASPAAAKKACLENGRSFAFLGNGRLSVRHVCELSYKMPAFVFHRLSRDVDTLRDTYAKDGVSIIVHKHPDERNPAVSVKIASENSAELLRPKADFERMLRGEDVTRDGKPIWDAFFKYSFGQQFLYDLQRDYPGLEIQSNPGRKTITLFGHVYVRTKAREAIIRRFDILHAKRIRSLELPGPLFAAFMRAEFMELRRTFGSENVWMLLGTKRLYIRGDDATFQQAKFLVSQVEQRLSVGSPQQRKSCVCPVCFDEPTEPIVLDCSHSWCRSCLVDYLNSAKDNRMFPLTCLGNGASCSQRIPLYIARDILHAAEYEALATAALMSYVNTRPNEFFYCPSPDCPQFYRGVRQMPKQAVIQCPSCLARICPHCHVFAHDGMTCAERDSQGDRLFREWTATHDVKPCPGCKAPIERTEGCNHMTCVRCETHICWVCLRTFEKGQGIYEHMRIVHGGIGL